MEPNSGTAASVTQALGMVVPKGRALEGQRHG